MGFYDDDLDRVRRQLDRVRRQLDDYESGARSLERQLDRTDQDNFNLRRELEQGRLERVRLEGEALELVAEVQRLQGLLQVTTGQQLDPICIGCNKHPDELWEYSQEATESDLNPVAYVRQEEGTYNRENGHFLCTQCYVQAGMPTAMGGWVVG